MDKPKEEELNRQLTQVIRNQEHNRERRGRLIHLEEECERLATLHAHVFSGLVSSGGDNQLQYFFSSIEGEISALHKQNLSELASEQQSLQKEARQLSEAEDELLIQRRQLVSTGEEKKEAKKDGA